MTCTFCKILNKELEASVVYEDAEVLAFLDIHPVNDGHVLVVPKRHVSSYTDLNEEEVFQVFNIGKFVAQHIKKSIPECEGVTLSLADGEKANQEVPHVHLHVIPRKENDGFGWKFPKHYSNEAVPRDKLNKVAKLITESLYTENINSRIVPNFIEVSEDRKRNLQEKKV